MESKFDTRTKHQIQKESFTAHSKIDFRLESLIKERSYLYIRYSLPHEAINLFDFCEPKSKPEFLSRQKKNQFYHGILF